MTRSLDPSILEIFLRELPAGSNIVVAGGEMSVMEPATARDLVETIVCGRPDVDAHLSLNLMQLPDWLVEICQVYFGGRVETSLAWSGRHRAGQTPREWRSEFLVALQAAVERDIEVEVFVEVEQALIEEGPDALLGFMDLVGARDSVKWALGPSVDTNRIISEGLDSTRGAPLRITHEQWETFCLYVGARLGMRSPRTRPWISPVSEILQGGVGMEEEKMGDVSQDICVSLLADGSLRANILYAEAQTIMKRLAPGWRQQVVQNRFMQDLISFPKARLEACRDCAYTRICDSGFVLADPRSADRKFCLGLSRLREMADSRNIPAQARPSR